MPDSPKKGHSKIRTFAQDFTAEQAKRGNTKKSDSVEETKEKPQPAPMAQAPSETKDQPATTVKPEPKPDVKKTEPVAEKTVSEPASEAKPEQPKAVIPSFHELQEEVSNIQLKEDVAAQSKTEPKEFTGKRPKTKPSRGNIGYDSKIITDTKHKRFKLFPAIKESLTSWFKALVKPRKKKTPRYVVPEADRRKGVIQKATSKSGSIFTADSSELKEKIRQRQLRQEEERQAAAQTDHEPETTWSPYTETGYDLLPEEAEAEGTDENTTEPKPVVAAPVSDTKNVTIEYKKQHTLENNRWHQETPTTPLQSEPEPVVVTDEPLPQVIEPEEVALPPAATDPAAQTPDEDSTQKPLSSTIDDDDSQEVKTIAPTSDDLAENEVTIHKGRVFGINRYSTNTLAVALLALIITVVIIVLVARLIMGVYLSSSEAVNTNTTDPVPGAQPSSLTATDSQSLLQQLENGSTVVNEFGYVDTQIYSPTGEVMSPARVMQLLGFQVQPSFLQSINDLRFVYLNQSKPILIFSFADTETIQGGFLAWEKTIFNDLRLIYDLPLNQNTTFSDQTIGDRDVRVLLSETGQTLIVYGLVNDNTALISNSLADFTQVVETSY